MLLSCHNCLVLFFFVFLTLMYRSVVLLLMMRNTDGFRALAFMLYGSVSLSSAVSTEFRLLTAAY